MCGAQIRFDSQAAHQASYCMLCLPAREHRGGHFVHHVSVRPAPQAPEVHTKLPYNEKVDTFSFAVLMFEVRG